ncbi:MAG: exodeoxyribonuclease VII large subunit, partial [bacterium]
MKGQLDIFAEEGAAEASAAGGHAPKKKRSGSRRSREVKKAPMLVDSFDSGERKEKMEDKVEKSVEAEPLVEVARNAEAPPRIYTIGEITSRIKDHLEGEFVDIWVTGEVTDFKGR